MQRNTQWTATRARGAGVALGLAVGCLAGASSVRAGVVGPIYSAPQFYAPTGSYYAYVTAAPAGITWANARAEAETLSFLGREGHLVAITSAGENQFLVDNLQIAAIDMYWLGGFQAPGSPEPAGGWQWVTGEAFSYNNWEPTNPEPNDGDGQGEEVLSFWRIFYEDPYIPGNEPLGTWNDEPDWYPGRGYIVEFPVPSPGPVALIGAGAVMATRRRRR